MKKLLFTILSITCYLQAGAQNLNPVRFRFYSKKINDTVTEICIEARIDSGWKIYDLNMAEGGPIKTQIVFKPSGRYRLLGNTIEPAPIKFYDDSFGMTIQYFDRNVTFIQKVITVKANTWVYGTLTYMVNNDSTCLPPESIDFRVKIG